MARIVVSQNDRLLLHLLEHDRNRDEVEVPMAVSQEGIASRLGTQVHNASRALSALQSDGLVSDRLAHVRGAPKRRRAYFLTDKGRRAAEAVRSDLGNRRIVLEMDGTAQELTLNDALRKAVSSLGSPVGLLDLVEVARENDVVRADSLRKGPAPADRRVGFVQRSHGRPKLEAFFGRATERRDVSDAISKGDTSTVLLWGIPGIGKSYLASKVYDENAGKRPMFWYTVREWDTESSFLTAFSGFLSMIGRGSTRSRRAAIRSLRRSRPRCSARGCEDRARKRGQAPFVRRPCKHGARLRAVPANGACHLFPSQDRARSFRLGACNRDAVRHDEQICSIEEWSFGVD